MNRILKGKEKDFEAYNRKRSPELTHKLTKKQGVEFETRPMTSLFANRSASPFNQAKTSPKTSSRMALMLTTRAQTTNSASTPLNTTEKKFYLSKFKDMRSEYERNSRYGTMRGESVEESH